MDIMLGQEEPSTAEVAQLDDIDKTAQPSVQLLEVNFGPDFTTMLRFYPSFVEDAFATLFSPEGHIPRTMWRV